MKLTQARQEYKCHECKKDINKGDKYKKKSLKFGSPTYINGYAEEETVEKINGTPVHVGHVTRVTVQLCFNCATKGMSDIDLQQVLRKEIKESINNTQRRINNGR